MNIWWLPEARSNLNPNASATVVASENRIFLEPERSFRSNFLLSMALAFVNQGIPSDCPSGVISPLNLDINNRFNPSYESRTLGANIRYCTDSASFMKLCHGIHFIKLMPNNQDMSIFLNLRAPPFFL